MTQTHPITPPPELVASLRNSAPHGIRDAGVTREIWLVNHAYVAGADQELEACLEHLFRRGFSDADILCLRAARRPQPPSLKKQAIEQLQALQQCGAGHRDTDKIFRALEALPND
jgi:hypothetical protein